MRTPPRNDTDRPEPAGALPRLSGPSRWWSAVLIAAEVAVLVASVVGVVLGIQLVEASDSDSNDGFAGLGVLFGSLLVVGSVLAGAPFVLLLGALLRARQRAARGDAGPLRTTGVVTALVAVAVLAVVLLSRLLLDEGGVLTLVLDLVVLVAAVGTAVTASRTPCVTPLRTPTRWRWPVAASVLLLLDGLYALFIASMLGRWCGPAWERHVVVLLSLALLGSPFGVAAVMDLRRGFATAAAHKGVVLALMLAAGGLLYVTLIPLGRSCLI
jgi:hypothetical protein